MQAALVVLHLIICLALIVIVLLQTGKGSEIGAVFGSSSQTLFGSTGGGTFFGKLTTGVAVVFLLTSLILAARSGRVTSESVMTGVQPAATAPAAVEIETPAETPPAETETPAEVPTPTAEEPPAAPPDSQEKQAQ
jgi:preprotein translocase subunit SecG